MELMTLAVWALTMAGLTVGSVIALMVADALRRRAERRALARWVAAWNLGRREVSR